MSDEFELDARLLSKCVGDFHLCEGALCPRLLGFAQVPVLFCLRCGLLKLEVFCVE